MTSVYKPGNVPDDLRQLPYFLRREFAAIKVASEAGEPVTRRQVLHVAPARAYEGDEVEADGTNWNPGSGRGKYVRRNGQWVFVGFISADWSTQVTGTGKPADNADVTTSVMGSSGTSILISSATLFKTTTGLGGVFIGSGGLVGKDTSGNTTFSINGSTGAAVFSGSLSAATGTFAGSLSAATGTFTGNITGTANIDITGQGTFEGQTTDGGSVTTAAVVANYSGASTYGVRGYSGTTGAGVIGVVNYSGALAGVYGISNYAAVPGGHFLNGSTGTGLVAECTGAGTALAVRGVMTITSTTAVTNLNADLLDGNHAAAFATAAHNHSGYQANGINIFSITRNTADNAAYSTDGGVTWVPIQLKFT